MIWEVIVQHVGCRYRGEYEAVARATFDTYKQLSKLSKECVGQVSGASVDLYADGEVRVQYMPPVKEGGGALTAVYDEDDDEDPPLPVSKT